MTEYDEAEAAHEVSRRRDRVEEFLVEQLRAADNQQHESNAEREPSYNTPDISDLRFDHRVDDTERNDTEDVVNPAMKLVETNSSSD